MSLNETLARAVATDDVVTLNANRDLVKNSAGERDINGRSLLHVAVAGGSVDAALWLLDNKLADVNAADVQGETPLMRAAYLGQEQVIETLLNSGASLEARSLSGATALHYAYEGGTPAKAAIAQLIEAGADTTALDKSGREPAAAATQAEAREEAAKVLSDGQVVGTTPSRRQTFRR